MTTDSDRDNGLLARNDCFKTMQLAVHHHVLAPLGAASIVSPISLRYWLQHKSPPARYRTTLCSSWKPGLPSVSCEYVSNRNAEKRLLSSPRARCSTANKDLTASKATQPCRLFLSSYDAHAFKQFDRKLRWLCIMHDALCLSSHLPYGLFVQPRQSRAIIVDH